jgi:hypothetical protein
MNWILFWSKFHEAWADCTSSPEYNKTVWLDMQSRLQILEKQVKGE